MRHFFKAVLLAALPFWLGGCGLFGGDDTATVPEVTPTIVPVDPPVAVPNTTAVPNTVPGAPAPTERVGVLPPDLISSTDPGQRVQTIQRNRPDPFAIVPTTPTVEITASPQPQPVPQVPSFAGGGAAGGRSPGAAPQTTARPQTAARPQPSTRSQQGGAAQPNRPETSGGSAVPAVPQNPVAVLPPPPPQPTLARAVKVTGVVQIGNNLHAIVSAPNEPSSRYVQVGQRLSNQQILVKRIEMNGPEPVVVLEQNGVEVRTAVGAGGTGVEASQPPV